MGWKEIYESRLMTGPEAVNLIQRQGNIEAKKALAKAIAGIK